MITPKLFFGINLDFDLTLNNILKNLSALKIWDRGLQKYLYIFPIDKLNEVIALTGKQIDFEGEKKEIMNIISHSPSLKQEITTEKYKGDGFVYIQKFPKLFIVKTIINKKPQSFKIPLETVKACWNALKQIDKPRKSKELAELWCKELKITRFNRESGSFDGDKLYGCRTVFFNFYFSLKVLEEFKLIKYEKSGYVTRLKDKWEYQGEIL